MTHDCKQEEELGRIKEFISSTKGVRIQMGAIVVAIIVQIGAFLFMWGGLTETVRKNSDQLWNVNTPCIMDNTRNIDKILARLDTGYFRTREAQAMSVK